MNKRWIVLALLALLALTACGNKNSDKEVAPSVDSSVEQDVKAITDSINGSYANSMYSVVQLSDTLNMTLIYDTTGKAYAETDYANGFYTAKDKSLVAQYDSSNKPYWNLETEYTPLYTVEKSAELLGVGKAELVDDITDSKDGYKTYHIKVSGANIKSLYDKYTQDALDQYCMDCFGKKSNSLDDTDSFNVYFTDKGENLSNGTLLAQSATSDDKIVWNYSGYFTLGALTFDPNLEKISSNIDFNSANGIITAEKDKIGSAIVKAVEENDKIKSLLENSIKKVG
jgi:lipoprotein